MTAYNRNFDLDRTDLDMIETALREQERELAKARLETACSESETRLRKVKSLLGRLHNQKVFFRPQSGPYVSG